MKKRADVEAFAAECGLHLTPRTETWSFDHDSPQLRG